MLRSAVRTPICEVVPVSCVYMYARTRVKQARFGKLAFLQLNGVIFYPKMSIFGHFALRFQQVGAVARKPCTFSRIGGPPLESSSSGWEWLTLVTGLVETKWLLVKNTQDHTQSSREFLVVLIWVRTLSAETKITNTTKNPHSLGHRENEILTYFRQAKSSLISGETGLPH